MSIKQKSQQNKQRLYLSVLHTICNKREGGKKERETIPHYSDHGMVLTNAKLATQLQCVYFYYI
jgi:hypothetical protein